MKCVLKRRVSSDLGETCHPGEKPSVEKSRPDNMATTLKDSTTTSPLPISVLDWRSSSNSHISNCSWEGLIRTETGDSMESMVNIKPALKHSGRVLEFSRLDNGNNKKSVKIDEQRSKKKSKLRRSRKRLSKLLHTHAALILLSVLVVLDATCVIGQLLADIFIVKVQLEKTEVAKEGLSHTLESIFPILFNRSYQSSLEEKIERLKDILEGETLIENFSRYINSNNIGLSRSISETQPNKTGTNKLRSTSKNVQSKSKNASQNPTADTLHSGEDDLLWAWKQFTKSLNEQGSLLKQVKGNLTTNEEHLDNDKHSKSKNGSQSKKSPSRKSGSHKEVNSEEHTLLEVTHIFHMCSLTILSILLLETLLKIFAMGRKLWNHKLEVFDAAIIIISWSLDLVFIDGIWDHPGSNAATILIILLPWRVMRIVNSFVLVIQEKDNVKLKLLKHRYRLSERRTRECKEKLNKYRVETRSLQGVCRKFGVPEGQITACMPLDKRGRSNLPLTALSQFASLAMVSSVGSLPNLATKSEYSSDSSMSDDDELIEHRGIDRTISADSAFSRTNSIFSTVSFTADNCADDMGEDNIAFTDETLNNACSLPTYEDAMILVINSTPEIIHSQNHHTKL